VIITERKLRSIVNRAFVRSVLREIAYIDADGYGRYAGMDPMSPQIKNISKNWALSDFLKKVKIAHEFANKTQQYKMRGPGELVKAWNAMDSMSRELLGILDSALMPYVKGASVERASKLEALLDYDAGPESEERIEKLIKHTEQGSMEDLSAHLNRFDELIEDSDADSLEVLARLEGVGAVQREMIKFLIEKGYGPKIHPTGAKKLSPEQEDYRHDAAELFRTRADREHARRQIQAQRAKQMQSPDDATPPQGTKRT
jgi:hypothetical protein